MYLLGGVEQAEKKQVYCASYFKVVQDFSAIFLAFCSLTFQIITAAQPKVLFCHNWVDPMYSLQPNQSTYCGLLLILSGVQIIL